MATPVLKKEYIDMVPEFSGEPELLSRFLTISEKLYTRFYNRADVNDFQNEYLLSSLIAKVKGPAAEIIYNSTILNFEDLKTSLKNAYSDRRDLITLIMEMTFLKQNINETPFAFYERLSKFLNLQLSYINTNSSDPEKTILIRFCNKYALRVLLKGLKEPVGSLMRTKNPDDLNSALNMLTNDFQFFDSAHKSYNTPPPRQDPKPTTVNHQTPQRPSSNQINNTRFTKPQPFQNKTVSQPHPQVNQQRPNYTPQPMSIGSTRNTNFQPRNYQQITQQSATNYLIENAPDNINSESNFNDEQCQEIINEYPLDYQEIPVEENPENHFLEITQPPENVT